MQQHQRLTRAVDLVIHLETVDIDIAGLCSAFFHSDAFRITGVVVGSSWSLFPNYWMLVPNRFEGRFPQRRLGLRCEQKPPQAAAEPGGKLLHRPTALYEETPLQ